MHGDSEENRREQAPTPLGGGKRATAKRLGACKLRLRRRAQAACPSHIDCQKGQLGKRSQRNTKVQQQERPNIRGNHRNQKTGHDGAEDNRNSGPRTAATFLRWHGRIPRMRNIVRQPAPCSNKRDNSVSSKEGLRRSGSAISAAFR